VDRYNRGLMIVARILVAMVFILNGFGIINQAIPAKEMMERGVPPAIVPLFMIAGRLLEIVAGFGLALGLFPRWCALALFTPRDICIAFVLAGGWHASVPRAAHKFLEECGYMGWIDIHRWYINSAVVVAKALECARVQVRSPDMQRLE